MLVVHRSERADRLVESLGDLLVVPPDDPFEPDVVAVPTRGVERWLTQRLSHRLGAADDGGVCANLRFPFPGALIGAATAAACGLEPDDDPWRPERAVWALLEVADERADDPGLAALVAHLRATTPADGGDAGHLRRFSALRHAADRFDHYAVHRPGLVRAWHAGEGEGWQPHLWRLLRARLGVPSPAERFDVAAHRLAEDPELVGLPGRLALFGLTRLPPSHLEILQALAAHRAVHLLVLHPSAALWDRVAPLAAGVPAGLARVEDPTARLPAHPLLRSWGRDARELQLVLAGRGVTDSTHRPLGDAPPAGILAGIQADIRADRRPPGAPGPSPSAAGVGVDARRLVDPGDRSLVVHACHGRTRQVEVVRDAVLHLLAADPSLEARDVIVLCPDIEAFAPLVQAVFGTDEPDGGAGRLRVRLADRSLRQTNPLLAVAATLLDLAGSRATAPAVLDLAARPAVARRFHFDQEDLATLEEWVVGSGIRWGLDAADRHRWRLGTVAANTWEAGLDRLLLGVAMDGPGVRWGGTVPYEDVPGGAVDLAGRFAELVTRLGASLDELRDPQPLAAWTEALTAGSELLAVAASGEEWQHEELRRVLADTRAEAAAREATTLTLAEARALLASRLQGRPTRANFRTGDLTVCTLVPMRSVPHRVVVLLGLDDGAFPRHPEPDGDDLLLRRPEVGDRDARTEDRQLLLDAVMAATDHLVVTYAGRDERTNRVRPPAVPVAELLDVVDATFRRADGRPARDAVVVEHPLHPFDERNFRAGGPGGAGPWGFDPVELAGAEAARHRLPAAPWLAGPLPPLDEGVVALDDLVRFVEHPVRAFLRRRLGLFVGERASGLDDAIPLELDGLQRWAVGDRLLATCLAGVGLEDAVAGERGRGQLPPGPLADDVLQRVVPEVEALLATVDALRLPAPGRSYDVRVELPGGRSLLGTVPGVRGGVVLACVYSRLSAKHRLAAWVRFLALTAARPDLAPSGVSIGRGGGGSQPATLALLPPLAADPLERAAAASAALAALVELRDLGMCEPLPLACKTSAAWAAARHRGRAADDAATAARQEWDGNDVVPGERDDPEHREVFGPWSRFDNLGAGPPDPGDEPAAATRFEALALRLWAPVLAHEQLMPAASSAAIEAVAAGGRR